MVTKYEVCGEDDKSVVMVDLSTKEEAPWTSLVPRELWDKCVSSFELMLSKSPQPDPPPDTKTVKVTEAMKQWQNENPSRSLFEVKSVQSKVGVVGSKVSLSQYALGSLLLSNQCPRYCSVREYIDSGFTGHAKLDSLRNGYRFLPLLIVNLVLSVLSVVNWFPSILSTGTLAIGIYLFVTFYVIPFSWKNNFLPGAVLVFSILGCLCTVSGFIWKMIDEPISVYDFAFWYMLWPAICGFQFVYLCLSTWYLLHMYLLFKNMSDSTCVPIPQVTILTFEMWMCWGLIVAATINGIAGSVFGFVLTDFHLVPIFWMMFMCIPLLMPAGGFFIGMIVRGYPKRVSVSGLVVACVEFGLGAVLCIIFGVTGELWPAHWS
ncbi:hypothetical protein Pelo_10838 [Pelomyxa schiedti]|nr:hypothetical protein Pelo_10838 [Pelomyxa schiedti]